ncbi:hypothetical protein G6F56_002116 [Rhizopus delemar]|nr:hypothetical protein G6F56_002116 [Rhizopus delemar]
MVFFSPNVDQQRGLHQGDPLSLLLFNLALEPLLPAINQGNEITGYTFFDSDTEHRMKTLAYADDICTILHNVNDYDRVHHHLLQYSIVSNAKFNKSKTEAFSLTGHPEDSWQSFVQRQQISMYHTARSPTPFRYLGYHIVYNSSQLVFIQDKLLTEVKEQVLLYSQRQLSLRGRVTIMNTLILSKIWYCLRLLQPTQSFFKSLRTIIYSFVWQRKRSLVSFDQLCLPIAQGGLGVLNPQMQHLVLQIRHLRYIFDNTAPPSLVRTALSLIAGHEQFNFISLIVPAFRKHNLNQPWSILHAIYKAYDHFDIVHDVSSLLISNQLKLPLNKFTFIPDYHWLHRHPRFLASDFIIIDDQTGRLRLRVRGEYPIKLGLCYRLYKDILQRRTISLQPYL